MEHEKVSRYFKIFGFLAMFLGFAIPFMIVINFIEATLFLVFFSHTISIIGIFSAMLGVTGYADDIARPW